MASPTRDHNDTIVLECGGEAEITLEAPSDVTLDQVKGFLLTCSGEEKAQVHELSKPDKTDTAMQARARPVVTVTPERGLVIAER